MAGDGHEVSELWENTQGVSRLAGRWGPGALVLEAE